MANRKPTWRQLALCTITLSWGLTVHAQAIAVPDAIEWSTLSTEQQTVRRAELRRQLQSASPLERESFRKRMRENLQSLSPQDRKALIEKTRDGWKAMTPEERERFKAERAAQLKALPPEQRKEWLTQRRAMLDKLSPEERAALREKLPAR
jgi:hypothetical protein